MSEATKPVEAPTKQATAGDVMGKLMDRLDAMAPPQAAKNPDKWPARTCPDICPPGFAIITDQFGQGRKLVHLLMVMDHAQEVIPMEAQFGGRPMLAGQLVDKVNSNQMIVEQFSPYPKGHIKKGAGRLFIHRNYIERDGVFRHPSIVGKA